MSKQEKLQSWTHVEKRAVLELGEKESVWVEVTWTASGRLVQFCCREGEDMCHLFFTEAEAKQLGQLLTGEDARSPLHPDALADGDERAKGLKDK